MGADQQGHEPGISAGPAQPPGKGGKQGNTFLIMVIKGNTPPLVGIDSIGRRLSHIMEKSGPEEQTPVPIPVKPGHHNRGVIGKKSFRVLLNPLRLIQGFQEMIKDIKVMACRLFHAPAREKLRHDDKEKSCVRHQGKGGAGPPALHDQVQFMDNTLRRYRFDPVFMLLHRGQCFPGNDKTKGGGKAKYPQQTQGIINNGPGRTEADHPVIKVTDTTQGINDRQLR